MSSTFSLKYMSRRGHHAPSLLQVCLVAAGLALLAAMSPLFAGNGEFVVGNEAVTAVADIAGSEAAALAQEPDLATAGLAAPLAPHLAAPAPAVEPLTPPMRAALGYVAQRYRVSAEALRPIFHAVQSTSQELSLDPLLIVAVIGVESRFNPFSQSVMGAQGLMQVIPRFHKDKLPPNAGKAPLLDPVTNVRVGSLALDEAIRRKGGLMEGLQQFAGATRDEEQTYATRVLLEKQRLEQAAARHIGRG